MFNHLLIDREQPSWRLGVLAPFMIAARGGGRKKGPHCLYTFHCNAHTISQRARSYAADATSARWLQGKKRGSEYSNRIRTLKNSGTLFTRRPGRILMSDDDLRAMLYDRTAMLSLRLRSVINLQTQYLPLALFRSASSNIY